MADYKARRWNNQEKANESEEMVFEARLLDLEKAYPRINRPCLWKILRKYGLKDNFLRTIMDLHETTSHNIKGKGGPSDSWLPQRGLKEGCPSSPVLFNIFNQVVCRAVEQEKPGTRSGNSCSGPHCQRESKRA